ncbi:hypothetical protein DI392_02890 [Vibrio albus]|uniref:VWFA domain-containing protein n=1 Tax=Vibrio albus TaxID=2200953 RepID=A0A2U3BEN5_9VIBR|nr:TadE/TadG family type IV pilus assembly protein [Vibrio albus]PWI35229.1 hypothetical protein DI392_02890 [Vibrio albus]
MKIRTDLKIGRFRQKGHAAIIFVLVAPIMFSLFSIAIDGARMMQNEARLDDALEIASLALAAENNPNDSTADESSEAYKGWVRNKEIATAYITEYMQGMQGTVDPDITKSEVAPENDDDPRYFEYTVEASTTHETIFKDDNTFGDSYDVKSTGAARKYQNQAIDIVFISDFSDTMNDDWTGGTQAKYLDLKDVIEDVTDYVSQYNGLKNLDDSTVGYVGFNSVTQQLADRSSITSDPAGGCTDNPYITGDCTDNPYTVSGYDAGWYATYYVPEPGAQADLCQYNQYINNSASDTVGAIFDVKTTCDEKTIWAGDGASGSDKLFFDENGAYFYDIALTAGDATAPPGDTSRFNAFNNQIAAFYPDWGTSSYEGLIRGAQIAADGDNPRRLLIILSDGMDNYPAITTSLVNAGMCTTITDTLDAQVTSKNYQVSSKIVLIGFDYDVSTNEALVNCVGTDNTYQAQNTGDILAIILKLITEEVGHLIEAGI